MLWKEGTHSSGQSLVANIPSELCIPMGLVLPDMHEFFQPDTWAHPEREDYSCIWSESCIAEKTMEDLLDRVRGGKRLPQVGKYTRKQKPDIHKKRKPIRTRRKH